MKFVTVNLKETTRETLLTELLFIIASERVQGTEVLRIVNDPSSNSDGKAYRHTLRIIRGLKEKKAIQFYATEQSFANGERESEFLLNKYPEFFTEDSVQSTCIYLKL